MRKIENEKIIAARRIKIPDGEPALSVMCWVPFI